MTRDEKSKDPVETSYVGTGLAIGLAIGAGLGVVFGLALGNMAFMSIGLGAGLSIGVAIGAGLDNRAKAEGTATGQGEKENG
jgi:hypothetical protein